MTAYYNEIDPFAAAWLRELIKGGHIAAGEVDTRSIEDVRPDDLRGFDQCHFFAGIGGWSLALRRAGWPDDRPVWTGSCPCQPFSSAGQGSGFDDERHLWPDFRWLVQECRPAVLAGEQVANAVEWLFHVRGDLEALGYAFGAKPIEAASAGSFHLRKRVFFVAHSGGQRLAQRVGNARILRQVAGESEREDAAYAAGVSLTWFNGPDGKRRPVESGIQPLANGVSARVGRLRGYGNAIDIRAATAFVAVMEECIS